MKQVQKTSSAELKREAGQLAQTSGKPIAQVARELGISETSLHQWRKDLAASFNPWVCRDGEVWCCSKASHKVEMVA